ncbi:MAG: hypothetical protein DRP47_08275 [Candidatus Zixiibacteriota bacterium]|nr:MAG: hypothetical protein DRP47_08275 [candidate division Zixibacteria bacterium]
MLNRFRRWPLWLLASFLMIASVQSSLLAEEQPTITVIYPKEGQVIQAIDSSFIFGNIKKVHKGDDWQLQINEQSVSVHPDGGFLAFVPIEPGEFKFKIIAQTKSPDRDYHYRFKRGFRSDFPTTELSMSLSVKVPVPLRSFSRDSLRFGDEQRIYEGDLVLSAGDQLRVSFQATPGCRAWFSVPGIADSIPMTEADPKIQAYWGESVFGVGAVPDSMRIRGIYTGFYDIPGTVQSDGSIRLKYYLAPPAKGQIIARYFLGTQSERDSIDLKPLTLPDTIITDSSSYTVVMNSENYPFTVRFTDSVQIVRYGPRKGYLSIFQPEGVEALAVGRIGDWYKLQLSIGQYGWVHHESVERLPKGYLPPLSHLVTLRTYSYSDHLIIEIPLSGKHPFKVIEHDRRTVSIRLYGVTSDTDWIRYDADDELVDLITWSQPEIGMYELTLQLTQDIWGYDGYYEGNTFYFQFNRPPENVHRLRGKTIVIDPGHSKDPGAIGPTGYTEAEANLGIALVLKKMLKKKGVNVVMTRSDASDVPLYDRPAIAKEHDADLFISIHNNALPDGVNPFVNNGSSTYYYHPHSLDLARAIHPELIKATGLDDHGLYHGNLAVLRSTQYPAVLVECAFMMIPEQEAKLKTGRFRYRIAKGLCKGIENFFKGYNRER